MDTVTLLFQVVGPNGARQVRFSVPDGEPVEAAFRFDCREGSQVYEKLEAIESNTCNYEDINFVGQQLWLELLSGGIAAAVKKVREDASEGTRFHVRLELPDDLRWLPWESLFDYVVGSLAGDKAYCIIHQPPPEAQIAPFAPCTGDKLAMLLIVPDGSGLNAGLEHNNIRREAEKRGVEVVPFIGSVTADALYNKLNDRQWDIVHFVGHGRENERSGRTEILLNSPSGDEHWMDADNFARQFGTAVRLAVMNCCFSGGSAERVDSLNGLGPLLMMRRGVPAVVAMHYAIADNMAILFSSEFYRALFNGLEPGRIDVALESARAALSRNQQSDTLRSFITPVLHLGPGYEQLFAFATAVLVRPPVLPQPPSVAPPVVLPPELLAAIRERRCIPVVGQGILRLGSFREQPPPPGLFELAKRLARKRGRPYPQPEDIKLCEQAGDGLSSEFLQRVCELYQQDKKYPELLEALVATYRRFKPTPLIKRLARWDVPGMFYTFFDGLLEECINTGSSAFTHVVRRLDDLGAGDPTAFGKQRLLILLRGSLSDPDSLVLTESDHSRLFASIVKMEARIAALAKQVRRSVIFLGVSPRDPLVRQLRHKLLEPANPRRRQGKTFFATVKHNEIDDANWGEFDVEWLDGELDAVLNAILEAAP